MIIIIILYVITLFEFFYCVILVILGIIVLFVLFNCNNLKKYFLIGNNFTACKTAALMLYLEFSLFIIKVYFGEILDHRLFLYRMYTL